MTALQRSPHPTVMSVVLLLTAVISCSHLLPAAAFTTIGSTHSRNSARAPMVLTREGRERREKRKTRHTAAFMSDAGGGDDDWFAELDSQPAAANTYAQADYDNNSYDGGFEDSYGRGRGGGRFGGGSGGGYNRGGRRGGGGGGGYPYSRDTSRDASNVDVIAVESLLAERSSHKRERNFEAADEIRDTLLKEYSVGVNDRERTWRTGCSISGSGMGSGGGYGRPQRGRVGRRGGSSTRGTVDFGPNGHDYDLSPDAGDNTSHLTEEDIHDMLAQRLKAKLAKKFNAADDIQAELINNGVYVHDGMKQWRADGVPFETLHKNGDRDQGGDRRMRGRRSAYEQSSHSLPYDGDVGEILEALQERERCRAQRDFASADRIRDYLMETLDLHIDDRLREWSVGGNFGDEINQQRSMSRDMGSRSYARAVTSAELDNPDDEAYVQEQVDKRQQAKFDRDYGLADDIRDELLEAYNVVIHDKARQWSVGGDFGDKGLNKVAGIYTRRGGGNLSDEEVTTVTSLVAERAQAKKDRNFDVADDIRNHLLEKYGVTIDDFCNEWRVATDDYVMGATPPGALSEDQIAFVQDELKKRAAFKKNRDYASADDIRDKLREEFGINIDDRTKEWSIPSDDYVMVPSSPDARVLEEDQIAFVQDELKRRAKFKKNRDYDAADDIRDDLQAKFGIDIDDRAQEWTVTQKGHEEDVDLDFSQDDFTLDDFTVNDEEDSIEEPEEVADIVSQEEDAAKTTSNSVTNNEEDDEMSEEQLTALTVPVLKGMLKERGLKVGGKKAELVERLVNVSS